MNQFTKKKYFEKFLKNKTIIKSQKKFRIFILISSNEYNLKINIICLQKKFMTKTFQKF